MLLPDHEIRNLCLERALITPFVEDRLQPSSYDVALGAHIMIESAETAELVRYNISPYTKENPYWLEPGTFILAETEEMFNMPDDPAISGQFVLKSSRARSGIQHMLAGFIDPGFHGSRLTLELKNVRQKHSIAIWPGMLIGQILLMPLTSNPERSYAQVGHYNRNETVMPSWESLKTFPSKTV